MSKHRAIWEQYVEAWKVPSAAAKRMLFEKALATQCVYTDPLTVATGWEALLDYMLEFQRQVPGGHFVTEQFIAHHDRSIARWRMVDARGAAMSTGMSYGEYESSGKLATMTGFFETPASPA